MAYLLNDVGMTKIPSEAITLLVGWLGVINMKIPRLGTKWIIAQSIVHSDNVMIYDVLS